MNNELGQSFDGVLPATVDDKFDMFAMSTGVPDFVKKLFRMLEDEAHRSVVCWGFDGDSFVVKDPNEFSKFVLPQHFKHNNFASFVRQLNKYDFHKVKVTEENRRYGNEAWEFKHPKFQHSRPDLLEKIKRKIPPKSKSLGGNGSGGVGSGKHIDNELRVVAEDLQSQIHLLTHAHAEVTMYMHQLGKQQQVLVDEVNGLKKNMQTQDQLMEEFVRYLVNQDVAANVGGNRSSHDLGNAATMAAAAAAAAAVAAGNASGSGAAGGGPVAVAAASNTSLDNLNGLSQVPGICTAVPNVVNVGGDVGSIVPHVVDSSSSRTRNTSSSVKSSNSESAGDEANGNGGACVGVQQQRQQHQLANGMAL